MPDRCRGTILNHGSLPNGHLEVREWITVLGEDFGGTAFWASCLLCMEHSGYCGAPLLNALGSTVGTNIWLENALHIKRSIGLQRGRSDKVDAGRIAAYCLGFQRKARLWEPVPASMERLGLLLSHRDRMVKSLMSLRNTLKEEAGFVPDEIHGEMVGLSTPAIVALESVVKGFDTKIEELLKKDPALSRQAEIVQSLPGFGPVVAPRIIEVTRGFARLTDPRAFACYAGVAPFEHSSGTSIRGRARVSHLANKDIKKMLHLAALVTIRKGNIMHGFYQRKVAEGKNKMSVINAVRNKLVHILLACIKNDTTYQKNYQHALA